jgi:hypothetical protein
VKPTDTSGTKRGNIWKLKLKNFKTNSEIKNIRNLYRGISDFEKGYQPRTSIVKDGKGDLVTDSCGFLAKSRNRFSQT